MNTSKKHVLIYLMSTILIMGCANTSQVYRYNDDTNYNSLFIQRDTGAKILIVMKSGKRYSGELLRVRDSSLILCEKYGATEDELSEFDYPLYSVKNQNIKTIELEGENHTTAGIVFGGLIGIALGTLVGYAVLASSDYQPFDEPIGYISSIVLIGGGTGMLIGGAIGGGSTTYDEEIYNYKSSEDGDFTQFNIYSRYGAKEPEFLKEIK